MAEKLGISVDGFNYCLMALIEKGLVKVRCFSNAKNRFDYVHVLTQNSMIEKAAITHRFLQRRMDECQALEADIEALKNEAAVALLKVNRNEA